MCDEKTKALDTGPEINMNSPGLRAVFFAVRSPFENACGKAREIYAK